MARINLLFLLATATASLTDCSRGTSLFKIKSMNMIPEPLIKGTNATLQLSMNVPVKVAAANATYSITYNSIPFSSDIDDLCLTVPGGCPILPGILNISSIYPVGRNLYGNVGIKIEWKGIPRIQLLCVNIIMKL